MDAQTTQERVTGAKAPIPPTAAAGAPAAPAAAPVVKKRSSKKIILYTILLAAVVFGVTANVWSAPSGPCVVSDSGVNSTTRPC